MKFKHMLEAWLYAREHNINAVPKRIGLWEWELIPL